MGDKVIQFRCKVCGSTQTKIRLITKDRICYSCGHVEPEEYLLPKKMTKN